MSSPVVGTLLLTLHLPESSSLRDKRQVLRSLQARIRDTYRVSVSETGYQDRWRSAELLVACAASDAALAEEILAKVVAYTEGYHLPIELIEAHVEMVYPF